MKISPFRKMPFAFSLLAFAFVFAFTSIASAQQLVHSCARPDQIAVKHLHLDLKVDFAEKKLVGSAALTLKRQTDANELLLDTNNLSISKIVAGDQELKWRLGKHVSSLGQSLSIELPAGVDKVNVFYSSSPGAEAVQWLSPEQTTDKKHPFLFTV